MGDSYLTLRAVLDINLGLARKLPLFPRGKLR